LHMHLKSKSCQAYALRMKIKVGQNYFYPDVLVDCSDVDGYFTETPTLIIEVLSKSTRKLDETTKWLLYLQIPTLLEYILVEQDCGLKSRGVVRVGSPCAIF
ncbi:MAG TPA: Uma2 family endonuclease, partial [Agitococcus sp.]|nr:Uma2 family endonuclease [Agitococcus sp.]